MVGNADAHSNGHNEPAPAAARTAALGTLAQAALETPEINGTAEAIEKVEKLCALIEVMRAYNI